MPRKKAIEKADPQIFHVSDHATVTITWDKGYRPKFYQPSDGVVIVGEHTCQPAPTLTRYAAAVPGLPQQLPAALVRNFEVAEDDPEYLAFKASLEARTGPPAPADFSPRVITSEDLLRAAPGFEGIDLNAAIANAPERNGTEG